LFTAKEQKFWDKSKKLRSYHRLLKKEGLESRTSSRDDSIPADYVPSTALRAANPDSVFAATEDSFSKVPAGRPKKKRAREEHAAVEGGDAAASSGSAPRAALPSEPEFKKQRRLTPAELAALKEEKRRAWEQKQKDIVTQQEKRKERHTLLTQKTTRGQPVLKNQMEYLLEKLQRQAAAASTTKK
jgi:hypothetical protein